MQKLLSHNVDVRRNVTAITARNLLTTALASWTKLTGINTITASAVSPDALYPAPFLGADAARYAPSVAVETVDITTDNQTNAAIRGQVLSSPAQGDYVFSVFAKRRSTNPATAFQMEVRGGGGTVYCTATFDVSAGGVITARSTSVQGDTTPVSKGMGVGVQAYGNGWYRCFINFNTAEMQSTAITTLTPYIRIWDTLATGTTVYSMWFAEAMMEVAAEYPRRQYGHPVSTVAGQSVEKLVLPVNYMVNCGGTNPFQHLPDAFVVRAPNGVEAWEFMYNFGTTPGAVGSILLQYSLDGSTWTTLTTLDVNTTPAGTSAVTQIYPYYRFTYGTGAGASATFGINPTDASGGNKLEKCVIEVFG